MKIAEKIVTILLDAKPRKTLKPKPKADLGFTGQGSGYNIGDNTTIGVAGGGG